MSKESASITSPDNPLAGMSYQEQLEVVQKDGYLLRYVQKQTLEVCLAAVQQDYSAMQYVWNDLIKQVNQAMSA